MATQHSPADDIVYDLVSVQYHALQGAENNDKYREDAHDHAEVREILRRSGEAGRLARAAVPRTARQPPPCRLSKSRSLPP